MSDRFYQEQINQGRKPMTETVKVNPLKINFDVQQPVPPTGHPKAIDPIAEATGKVLDIIADIPPITEEQKEENGIDSLLSKKIPGIVSPPPPPLPTAEKTNDQGLELPYPEPVGINHPEIEPTLSPEISKTAGVIIPYPLNTPHEDLFDTEIHVERNAHEVAAEIIAKRAKHTVTEYVKKENRLYEIAPLIEQLMVEIENHAEENEGEMPLELCDALEALEMEREKKLINCSLLYKDLIGKASVIKDEAKRLQQRQKSLEKKAENLLNYVQMNMQHGEKIEDHRFKISWKKSTKCVITDVDKLPEGTYEVIKKPLIAENIKPLLKDGSKVPGAELKPTISMSIK